VTLARLNATTTYYWRVKTTAGDNPSIVSATSTFTIGPLRDSGAHARDAGRRPFPHKRPVFTVANAARTGPPATLTYGFEIASDADFNTLVTKAPSLRHPIEHRLR
jgi:hypothetical protein